MLQLPCSKLNILILLFTKQKKKNYLSTINRFWSMYVDISIEFLKVLNSILH